MWGGHPSMQLPQLPSMVLGWRFEALARFGLVSGFLLRRKTAAAAKRK
jgi:hypothetical protein